MRSSKKAASAPPKKSPSDSDLRSRVFLHLMIFVIFASAIIALVRVSQLYVERRIAFPTRPPKVVLANRPVWMSDFLAEQIIKTAQPRGLHSAFDHQLLVETVNALSSDPWVKQVNQVRRLYVDHPGDTLEIDCDYRAPAALVKWGQNYWLVDGEGVKLPEQYTAAQVPKIIFQSDGKMNVRIIDGVSHAPSESGRVWPGDDLASGLELAKLIAGRDWAEQVRDIDVSNYAGRRDERRAQIVLTTGFGTQIRWGRPPNSKDSFVEVSPAAKLDALENIFRRDGRVDAQQPWIDIRFDQVTCPGPAKSAVAASSNDSDR